MVVEYDVKDEDRVRGARTVRVTPETPLPVVLVGGGAGGPVAVPDGIEAEGTPSGTTFLRGDGQWATPTDTNTTYTSMSASEAQAGTATTARVINAKVLADEITRRLPAGLPTAPSTGSYTLKSVDGVISWVEDIEG